MIFTTNIWHTYFYIFCKWFVIFYFIFCTKEVILGLIDIIRMSMVSNGPCKALKELSKKVDELLAKDGK